MYSTFSTSHYFSLDQIFSFEIILKCTTRQKMKHAIIEMLPILNNVDETPYHSLTAGGAQFFGEFSPASSCLLAVQVFICYL